MFPRIFLYFSSCIPYTVLAQINVPKRCFSSLKFQRKGSGYSESLKKLIENHRNKIIYNTYVYNIDPIYDIKKKSQLMRQQKRESFQFQTVEPLPISLKYLQKNGKENQELEETNKINLDSSNEVTHFPYQDDYSVKIFPTDNIESKEQEHVADIAKREITLRQEHYNNLNQREWMKDYENYDEIDEEVNITQDWKINYGTPDPNAGISNTPCGGCGALLHCKDTSIPGYIPSEIYKNCTKQGGIILKGLICQRCHFLKNYNLALQVRVSPEDYPKILTKIQDKYALIILVVDLLDFPCSVWPNISEILGSKKPIVVVGNKVDLLPSDCPGYLNHIKEVLKETVCKSIDGKASRYVKHVALVSAKTGWGVEELITKLHNLWLYRGDVYLVGCTNVGKSSLFNCLLQSDYCKIQAVDLIQRATTSVWPGTTLNLLKFPILRPSAWRLHVRTQRLKSLQNIRAAENRLNKIQLRKTKHIKYATLMGHLDRTFSAEVPVSDSKDPFAISGQPNSSGQTKLGIDERDPKFMQSKWCYDTPGVVQPDQIIHLLTTEELMLTLPRELIRPQTFSIRTNQTLFIAGIGRLDYLDGPYYIRLTVFCSSTLPITLCNTEDADELYNEFLGTELLEVPKGTSDRLQCWPKLKASEELIKLQSKEKFVACRDIVLSNAGWISVTINNSHPVSIKAWTPEARGIYLRNSILPYAVSLRGKKIRKTPAYEYDKFFIAK